MKRIQLFEFEDQKWVPNFIRDYIRDAIMHLTTDIYRFAVPKVLEVLQNSKSHKLLDLCSGAGGPAPIIYNILSEKCGYDLELTLTDKFVHAQSKEKYNKENNLIEYHPESIDALKVPNDLKGVRTIFTSFHHFNEDEAKRILSDSKSNLSPIAIFELTERKVSSIFTMFLSTIILLLTTPLIKPFDFKRLFWTYIFPIIPIMYYWDSVISHLRSYTVQELIEMINKLESNNYKWEIGQIETSFKNKKITYVIGHLNK